MVGTANQPSQHCKSLLSCGLRGLQALSRAHGIPTVPRVSWGKPLAAQHTSMDTENRVLLEGLLGSW